MIFNKITFIHIPKTAGSSIINSLNKNYILMFKGNKDDFIKENIDPTASYENTSNLIGDFDDHLPFGLIKLNKNYLNNKIFTFVRNPFSRAVSLYFECLRSSKTHKKLKIDKNTIFEDFLTRVKENDYWFTMPMINWIGIENINKIDHIAKFENFDLELKKITKKLDIKIDYNIHNINNSIGSKYSPSNYINFYKNENTIGLIKDIYKYDLLNFDYNFENFKSYEKKKINKIIKLKKLINKKIFNFLKK